MIYAHKQCRDIDCSNISKACYGMLFFGVPNLGLRNEQLMTIVWGQPNQSLIHDLKVDDDTEPSTYLKSMSDQFSECCKDKYPVVSFFERQRSPTVEVSITTCWVGKPLIVSNIETARWLAS